MRFLPTLLCLSPVVGAGLGCAATAPGSEPSAEAPYVLVLGTAQDGGLPQTGCRAPLCADAREDPARRRLVTSLLLVDPRSGRRWLFDASPDLSEQVARAADHAAPTGAGRPPLFDGIFLTHAHVGHYAGLLHLGREAYATEATPVHASERMLGFLSTNGPWELLFRAGHLVQSELTPDVPVELAPDLSVTPFTVPHRPEYSDTLGFLIRGPERSLLYLPDIDKWERWERPIEELLRTVDVALVDGTFFADGEIPGRSLADIPHPFIRESLLRFAALPAAERTKVRFTHLNHTNPASDPEGPAAREVAAAGMAVAADGETVRL